ncbi:MAG: hypothetical protein AAFS07_03545 [Pseudomonadota bacterium]
MKRITLSLFGPFSVVSDNGQDLTPSSTKACGLLALLATGRAHRRSRAWLQDKLWSDRAPRQAAGSLRQALVEARRALGIHAQALVADRSMIALDHERIRIAFDRTCPSSEAEFLQGIDLRDPEFETWLRDMRAHYAQATAAAAQPTAPLPNSSSDAPQPGFHGPAIALIAAGDGGADARLLETLFIDAAAHSMREVLEIHVYTILTTATPRTIPSPGSLIVTVKAFVCGVDQLGLRVTLEEAGTLRSFWAEHAMVALPLSLMSENVACLALVHRLLQALTRNLAPAVSGGGPTGREAAAQVTAIAGLRKMFSMRHSELLEAEHMFAAAIEREPRGLYYAWRAQLAVIRFVELAADDVLVLKAECAEHCARAMELEPLNSHVLAAVANAKMLLERDLEASTLLSQQAVSANRANPLAWWSWANVTLYRGELEMAHAAAVIAQSLTERSSLKFWADFQRSLTAALTGRREEAIRFGTSASALAPSFRPPLRYLVALHAARGDRDATLDAAEQLRRIEDSFSIDKLLFDPEYPVSLMRKTSLLTAETVSRLDII